MNLAVNSSYCCFTPRSSRMPSLCASQGSMLASKGRTAAIKAGPLAASTTPRQPSQALIQQVKPIAATLAALLPLLTPLPASAFEAVVRHTDPGMLAMPWLSITFGAILFSAVAPRQLGFVDGSPALGGADDFQNVKESVDAQLKVPDAEPTPVAILAAEAAEEVTAPPMAESMPEAALAFEDKQEEAATVEEDATLAFAEEAAEPELPASAPVLAFTAEPVVEAELPQESLPLAFFEEDEEENLVVEYAGPDAGKPAVAVPAFAVEAEPITAPAPTPVATPPIANPQPVFAATAEAASSAPQPEKLQQEYVAKVTQLKELAAKKEQEDSRRWQTRFNVVEQIRSTAQTMREESSKQSKASSFNPRAVLASFFEALVAAWTNFVAALKGVTSSNLLTGKPVPKQISDKPQLGGAV